MAGVTALFKSGAKTAPAKAKSIAKSATKKIQKSVPRPATVKKEVKKALPKKVVPPKPLKKALPKAPPKPVQKAIPKPVAKKATQVVRKATSNVKKATSRVQYGGAQLDKWYGPSRALYLPGGLLDRSDIPTYLNGSLAGDYGYDPLELGKSGDLEKYRANELIHARWAMLGAAGAIIPEGLQANGADIKGGTWFETGAEMLNGGTLNYFAVPWTIVNNPLPLILVALIEVGLIGGAEKYRSEGQGPPGYSPGVGKFDSSIFAGLDNLYPGGPFDPLGLADDPETLQELKVKEIKNGRLAMISFLGFAVQAAVTGEGPYANWTKHLADPFGYNLLTILGAEERLPTL